MKKWKAMLSGSTITGVHIGGGTPSVLSAGQIKRLFDSIIENIGKKIPEITFESNPASLTLEKTDVLATYDNVTVNMGIQSFVPERLAGINRYINVEKIKEVIRYICGKRSLNFGIDLIVGLPGAKNDDYDAATDCIRNLDIKNVFIYPYRLEENSFFYKNGSDSPVERTDSLIGQMEYVERLMSRLGFKSKTVYYWTKEKTPLYLYAMHQMNGKEWVGIGAGAYSYIDKSVIYNEASVDQYVSGDSDFEGCTLRQNVSSQLIWDMTFMIKMTGFDFERISLKYGKIATGYIQTLTEKLVENGYCEITDGKACLTVKGKIIMDDVETIIREVVLN
jgi:oxygen-independent coproporphyrinogen-3 oxidase